MRDYKVEFEKRIEFVKNIIENSKMAGIVYGNSGGKDSTLVGIICKAACEKTVGVIMPCASKRNFEIDMKDGMEIADKYGIETRIIDLTSQRELAVENLKFVTCLTESAKANIAPRLRMLTLYAIAASEKLLVAGTGNRSEAYMGYFTKWGDGAYDLNPIADLTVTEIYEFLKYLNVPANIIEKAPSAGLFEGQTDEAEMGVTYKTIDEYLLSGKVTGQDLKIIENYHKCGEHKCNGPINYGD